MAKIYPYFSRGFGNAPWPLSRKSYPKQFSNLIGEKTLFQSSAQRLTSSETLEFASHITLTNSDYRFIVGEQLQEVGIDPGPILIEPEAKNTAAAILAANIFAHSKDENAVLLVAPSDHVIPGTETFMLQLKLGYHMSKIKRWLLWYQAHASETGYGYLELAKDPIDDNGTSDLEKFIENLICRMQKQMLEAGHYLWNAGIFLFRAQDMIDAFKTYAPETLELSHKL